MLSTEEIEGWPKAELHVHLDGSLRLKTLLELARAQGKSLPADSEEGLGLALLAMDDAPTLVDYLAWFRHTLAVMQTVPALTRIAYELAMDAAAENVRYIEIRFSPILHVDEHLSLEAVLDAVIDGLRRAQRETGIRSGIIVCALRGRHADASMRLAELAVAYRNRGVVGFDLAGPEAGYPAKEHLRAFYHARNNLLGLTIHAGESWPAESIRQALFFCGAHRIGHGISVAEDPELLRYVVDHRIPLEICPTSNVQTHVVDGYEQHPIRALADANAVVTIHTDNRLFSRTTVTREYDLAHTRCGLTEDQMRRVAVDAFRYAFLPWDERKELIDEATTAILTA